MVISNCERTIIVVILVTGLILQLNLQVQSYLQDEAASSSNSSANSIPSEAHGPSGSTHGDSCHLREMELCLVGGGSFLQNSNGIPVSKVELERQCELFQESSECFVAYSQRCMMSRQFTFVNLFTGSLFELERDFCIENGELRKNYTKHAPCLRNYQKRYQNKCLTQFQVAFEPIHKMKRSDRMSLACCNFMRLKQCFEPAIEEECGSEALDLVLYMVEKALGKRLWIMCRNYDSESERCRTLLPNVNMEPHNGRNTSALSRIISSYTRIHLP